VPAQSIKYRVLLLLLLPQHLEDAAGT
jgi:hypothetical protein